MTECKAAEKLAGRVRQNIGLTDVPDNAQLYLTEK
jgi:hypothetical protein